MTFDGSPEHTRHGVGGLPKASSEPSRSRPFRGGWILLGLFLAAIVLVVVVAFIGS
tara:strand:- start:159 stop:326 length:168 start_codon:yes stop_codon:yes gene_type:complete